MTTLNTDSNEKEIVATRVHNMTLPQLGNLK